MSSEDIFEGARTMYTFFSAYRAALADALGEEQIIALDKKIFEILGTNFGHALKEHVGDKDLDVKEAIELVKGFLGSMGMPLEVIEESPTMVRCKVGHCPIYEGSQRAGLDYMPLEVMCRSAQLFFMDALVKAFNPNLSYQLIKFRSAPEDFCEEAIVLRTRKEEEDKWRLWRKGDRKPPFF
jgi:hypothetical protein